MKVFRKEEVEEKTSNWKNNRQQAIVKYLFETGLWPDEFKKIRSIDVEGVEIANSRNFNLRRVLHQDIEVLGRIDGFTTVREEDAEEAVKSVLGADAKALRYSFVRFLLDVSTKIVDPERMENFIRGQIGATEEEFANIKKEALEATYE